VSIGVLESTQLNPAQWLTAEVVQSRPTVDLALLHITDSKAPELPTATIDESEMNLGDEIYLIGFPDYGTDSAVLTDGMVAGRYESDYGYFVMATAAISGGNSGGPAVSANGRVVGISTLGAPVQIICTEEGSEDNWCSLKRSQMALVRPIMFARPLLDLIGKGPKSP
jgi:S1-C subfamily serine protease